VFFVNTAMINTNLLVTFTVASAVLMVIPGPSAMFIVSRALCVGRPAAMAAAVGNTLGNSLQGLLAAFGLGAVIGESDALYNGLKLGGAAYLVAMGATTLRHREFADSTNEPAADRSTRRAARQGFLVGATNPKTIVFFAAALPQFVDPSRGQTIVQMLVLLAVYTVLSIISDTAWGFAGASIRTWAVSAPKRIERLIGAGGLCIIGFGVSLAFSGNAS
jgi:threonine/homoserine/homoserine lactone efflux protein